MIRYALEAFEVCAVDYLLKPFDQERFRKTLNRVRPRHAATRAGRPAYPAGRSAGAASSAMHAKRTKSGRGCSRNSMAIYTYSTPRDVEMIEADRNYVVHTRGKRQLFMRAAP